MLVCITVQNDQGYTLVRGPKSPRFGFAFATADRSGNYGTCSKQLRVLCQHAIDQHPAIRHACDVDPVRVNVKIVLYYIDDRQNKADIVNLIICRFTTAVSGVPVLQQTKQTNPFGVGDQETLLISEKVKAGFKGNLLSGTEGTVDDDNKRLRLIGTFGGRNMQKKVAMGELKCSLRVYTIISLAQFTPCSQLWKGVRAARQQEDQTDETQVPHGKY